jgi:hypothetical protein
MFSQGRTLNKAGYIHFAAMSSRSGKIICSLHSQPQIRAESLLRQQASMDSRR